MRFLTITATLPAGARTLLMDSVQARHLQRGWGTFVRDLSAQDNAGDIGIQPSDSAAKWRLVREAQGSLRISYVVDLGFAREHWPAGNEQAGAVFDDGLYVVGRPIFVTSDRSEAAEVRFVLPEGWRASSPLDVVSPNVFYAETPTQLVRNALLLGRHTSVLVTEGPFELELALPGGLSSASPLVEPLLKNVTRAYLTLFPQTPRGRFLMTFFHAAADDGESFVNSASFTTSKPVESNGILIWGNFLAHELMHYWNGQRIRGAAPRGDWRWLAEGFTEYYANITLARVGAITKEDFLKKAERHLGNYLYFATAPHLDRLSLVAAGANTTVNRFGVYDGGWTVALCVDGFIREMSGDARSLDDFMRVLWRRFSSGEQKGYRLPQLDEVLGGLGVTGLSITQLVTTEGAIDVDECVARFGFDVATKGYAAEAFLTPAATASDLAHARFRRLLSHP